LIGLQYGGMFSIRATTFRGLRSMAKTPKKEFGTPPLLGDKLIAQLQGAVNDAQRKRSSQSNQGTDSRNDFSADGAADSAPMPSVTSDTHG
jgi:hypothetical protein